LLSFRLADNIASAKAPGLESINSENKTTLEGIYRAAAAAKGEFDFKLAEIAHQAFGRYIETPLKAIERAAEKVANDYRGDATRIKDILRSTIEVDSPTQAYAVIDQIRQNFKVLDNESKNTLAPETASSNGYRDAKIIVDLNGVKAEIQINLPEMVATKKAMHGNYVRLSELERKIASEDRQPTKAEKKRLISSRLK
jgi:hypothetical protein